MRRRQRQPSSNRCSFRHQAPPPTPTPSGSAAPEQPTGPEPEPITGLVCDAPGGAVTEHPGAARRGRTSSPSDWSTLTSEGPCSHECSAHNEGRQREWPWRAIATGLVLGLAGCGSEGEAAAEQTRSVNYSPEEEAGGGTQPQSQEPATVARAQGPGGVLDSPSGRPEARRRRFVTVSGRLKNVADATASHPPQVNSNETEIIKHGSSLGAPPSSTRSARSATTCPRHPDGRPLTTTGLRQPLASQRLDLRLQPQFPPRLHHHRRLPPAPHLRPRRHIDSPEAPAMTTCPPPRRSRRRCRASGRGSEGTRSRRSASPRQWSHSARHRRELAPRSCSPTAPPRARDPLDIKQIVEEEAASSAVRTPTST